MSKKWSFYSIVFVGIFMVTTAIAANLSDLEKLGEAVYNNKNLSFNRNQSCQTCHHQKAAFADPVNQASPIDFPVSEGSKAGLFGDRNAPSAAYAGFSPILHWNGELFIGGVFWDGRASGRGVTDTGTESPDGSNTLSGTYPTYDPMADQAKGPFQNPIEMALNGLTDVVDTVLKDPKLFKTFAQLFPDAFDANGAVLPSVAYNYIAEAIAAFERSSVLNRFSSRFDKFAKEYGGDINTFGVAEIISVTLPGPDEETWDFRVYGGPGGFTSKHLTQNELIGLALFNSDSATQLGVEDQVPGATNGGMCYLCHLTTPYDTADYDTNLSLVAEGTYPPLFTDFSYDNLGIPVNETARNLSGLPIAPEDYQDLGLGAQTAILEDANPGYTGNEDGKFKVPSLRGVAKSAPYGHNGFFPTLTDIVNFYNLRTGTPEVATNMNESELGNLGMGILEVDAIVAFMKTLTDE